MMFYDDPVHDCIDREPPRCEHCRSEMRWHGSTQSYSWCCPECDELDDQE